MNTNAITDARGVPKRCLEVGVSITIRKIEEKEFAAVSAWRLMLVKNVDGCKRGAMRSVKLRKAGLGVLGSADALFMTRCI
jgi:hypothetical protein